MNIYYTASDLIHDASAIFKILRQNVEMEIAKKINFRMKNAPDCFLLSTARAAEPDVPRAMSHCGIFLFPDAIAKGIFLPNIGAEWVTQTCRAAWAGLRTGFRRMTFDIKIEI